MSADVEKSNITGNHFKTNILGIHFVNAYSPLIKRHWKHKSFLNKSVKYNPGKIDLNLCRTIQKSPPEKIRIFKDDMELIFQESVLRF